MFKTISTADARKRFAEITDDVRMSGHTYSIVRHGREVARLVPPQGSSDTSLEPNLDGDLKEFFDIYNDAMVELAKR